MANPAWPAPEKRTLIGQRISRADGPVKVTGRAKYAYDMNPQGLLHAKLLGSRHPAAIVKAIDTSAAEKAPGVRAVWVDEQVLDPNTPFQVQYAGQVLAAVAADTEEQAADALRLIQVTYEVQPHNVVDTTPAFAKGSGLAPAPAAAASVADTYFTEAETKESDNVAQAFQEAEVVSEGHYGIPTIAHCCLEAHGQTSHLQNGELTVWPSTQSVSRYVGSLGYTANVPENKITVDCQYMGGGFGSKFSADKWGDIAIHLSERSGRPVRLMLDRDLELTIAGNRPSAFANIRIAAKKDGTVTGWESEVWGSQGWGEYGGPNLPYIFTKIPEQKSVRRGIQTNRGSTRAWRAPNHPQMCFLTLAAMDDLAATLGMDALEFFKKAADLTERPDVYKEELDIAAEMIGYAQKAHARGDSGSGPVKRGLGISMHTWGGRGHESQAEVVIAPDGSVETRCGTQDLGTGTRTVCDIVVAETLGIPMERVNVNIGTNKYPASGASGGSTTVGGVSAAHRLAATDALNQLLALVAPKLGVAPEQLEAHGGVIRAIDNPSNSMPWEKACALIGQGSITGHGHHRAQEGVQMGLIDSGVGGVQIADVSVDVETGVVRINEMVAVQDCGLILDLKTAESQCYGGLIMGITYALYEECVYDPVTGRMLNPNMEFYKLAGLPDVGTLRVHMMTDEKYQKRGVIGLGEPPVISPGAAISNAVANAIGVRVPHLPLTPERVLAALAAGGTQA